MDDRWMHGKPLYQMTGHELWAAAQSGQDAAALLTLARMMAHGFRGLHGDEAQVMALEQQAAALGHPRALRGLGDRYSRGAGVASSDEAAVMWWRRAAQAGDLDAMANLGSALAATAPAEAHAWLAHAATHGHPYAISALSTNQPRATLGDFANMTLEQMAAGVADASDDVSWNASEVKATAEQLNHMVGLWIEHLRTRLFDVTTTTTIDGDDADFPCPDPRALPASIVADNATIEVTVRSGVVHLQLDATWWDDGWSLSLTSYEPHPPAEARAWLLGALTTVATQLGIHLVTDD